MGERYGDANPRSTPGEDIFGPVHVGKLWPGMAGSRVGS